MKTKSIVAERLRPWIDRLVEVQVSHRRATGPIVAYLIDVLPIGSAYFLSLDCGADTPMLVNVTTVTSLREAPRNAVMMPPTGRTLS